MRFIKPAVIIAVIMVLCTVLGVELDRPAEPSFVLTRADTSVSPTSAPDTRININTADVIELSTLPGIGETLAQRIIDYRTINGDFNSTEELKNITGIGDKKYDAISSLIRVK